MTDPTGELARELDRARWNGCVGQVLVSETGRVRVWSISLAPGERLGFHHRVLDYFWTAVMDGRASSRHGDGSVDETTRRIRLRPERVKTNVGRTIPLSEGVFMALSTIPRSADVLRVFVNPDTGERFVNVQKGWRGIRKRAGLPKLRLHDLRHTFQHLARDSRMSEEDRMTIAGHSSEVVHRRCARGGTSGLHEEMEKHSPLAGAARRTYRGTVTPQEPKSTMRKRRKKSGS